MGTRAAERRFMTTILLLSAVTGGLAIVQPPVPQPASYHLMADQRAWMGIPNALDVLSNMSFAIVGLLGLVTTFDRTRGRARFADPWERWPYAVMFAGVTLTALGSSYYHVAPDNTRLVWDRLPMTAGFMGLLAATVGERISVPAGRRLLAPLMIAGAASVFFWYWTELQGQGNLRPYLIVQFGSLLLILLMACLFPPRYSGTMHLLGALSLYAMSKFLEIGDRHVFELRHIVSGHTLKHLSAALAVLCLVHMLRVRNKRLSSTGGNQSRKHAYAGLSGSATDG